MKALPDSVSFAVWHLDQIFYGGCGLFHQALT
jgi:hypothetical protein